MSRNAVVTGANRGLGLEFTRQLLARGDRVVATCRQPGKATELNALVGHHPGRLRVVPLDVADAASRAALVAELPLVLEEDDRIDLLINNAGVLHSGERFGHLQQATLDDSLRTNAIAPLLLAQALVPWFANAAEGGGLPINQASIGERLDRQPAPFDTSHHPVIANLSSQLGSIAGVTRFGAPSYAISKAAQNMATAQLAKALQARGVVVLALHPGWAQTAMGGPQATDAPADVVAGMLGVIEAATLAQSGGFFDWRGQTLPW
ncbi:MAG: SDR family oxidoreductase [Thermomonas sp.]|uniref:SDR family oxidoreductase n=1 Tax=Thermomonas sp. TaxID=1971895 RepID=UPI002634B1C4|nr:SDR family oxidoreductase [Thermomonas sp.]MCC7097405.1 SDR family oxidoreductase [Thermomonas sp.]